MKIIGVSSQASQITKNKESQVTAAPAKRQASTVAGTHDFALTTRKDGAIVVIDGAQKPVVTVAPAQPYTKKAGDKPLQTHILSWPSRTDENGTEYAQPRFKITPFLFETPAGDTVADGLVNYQYAGQNLTDTVDIKVALRPYAEFEAGDEGPRKYKVTTMFVFDSVFTLAKAPHPAASPSYIYGENLNDAYTQTSSFTPKHTASQTFASPSNTSPVSLAAPSLATGHSTLSPHAIGSIAAGASIAALSLVAGATLLYRKIQQGKRKSDTQAFAIKMKPLKLVRDGAETV